MTAAELHAALGRALASGELRPDDELWKNDVGNLAVLRAGEYVAWVELPSGRVGQV